MGTINRAFVVCGAASIAAIAISVLADLSLPQAIVLELGPLIAYFTALARKASRENGLAGTAIDSVYYFGFLITIFALAASVFRIWKFGLQDDISGLLAHFGVGLLATGLALAFRLYLVASTQQLDKKELDEAVDDFVNRISSVVDKVEVAAAAFESLAESLEKRTAQQADKVFDEVQKLLSNTVDAFKEEIGTMVKDTSVSVGQFSSTMQTLAASEHVVAFNRNMGLLSDGLNTFRGDMIKFASDSAGDLNATLRKSMAAQEKLHVEALQGFTAECQQAIAGMRGNLAAVDFTEDIEKVRKDMTQLANSVTAISRRFHTIDGKLEELTVTRSAEASRAVIDRFVADLSSVSASIGSGVQQQLATVFSQIGAEAKTSLDAAGVASTERLNRETAAMASNLAAVNQALAQATVGQELTKIATNAVEANQALSAAGEKIAGLAAEIEATTRASVNARQAFEKNDAGASLADLCDTLAKYNGVVAAAINDRTLPNATQDLAQGTSKAASEISQAGAVIAELHTRLEALLAGLPATSAAGYGVPAPSAFKAVPPLFGPTVIAQTGQMAQPGGSSYLGSSPVQRQHTYGGMPR